MTQIKPNRRAHKTLHKTYRFHKVDLWGVLGTSRLDKKVTEIVAEQNRLDFLTDTKKLPHKIGKIVRQKVLYTNEPKKNYKFLFQLSDKPTKQNKVRKTLRLTLLRLRRQLSLFYGGGRIRTKTFRRLSKTILERSYKKKDNKIGSNLFVSYIGYKTFARFLESRLDVLLLRCGLWGNIYTIRQAIYHRKAKVRGQTHINHPGFLLKVYREFFISKDYTNWIKKNHRRSINRMGVLNAPAYLWVNFSLLTIFKIFEPNPKLIHYPFKTPSYGPLVFKYIYNKH